MATAHLHLLLLAMHTHPLPSRMDSIRAHPLLLATWDTPIQLLLLVENSVICSLTFLYLILLNVPMINEVWCFKVSHTRIVIFLKNIYSFYNLFCTYISVYLYFLCS